MNTDFIVLVDSLKDGEKLKDGAVPPLPDPFKMLRMLGWKVWSEREDPFDRIWIKIGSKNGGLYKAVSLEAALSVKVPLVELIGRELVEGVYETNLEVLREALDVMDSFDVAQLCRQKEAELTASARFTSGDLGMVHPSAFGGPESDVRKMVEAWQRDRKAVADGFPPRFVWVRGIGEVNQPLLYGPPHGLEIWVNAARRVGAEPVVYADGSVIPTVPKQPKPIKLMWPNQEETEPTEAKIKEYLALDREHGPRL